MTNYDSGATQGPREHHGRTGGQRGLNWSLIFQFEIVDIHTALTAAKAMIRSALGRLDRVGFHRPKHQLHDAIHARLRFSKPGFHP